MKDFKEMTYKELIQEWNDCEKLWSRYGCDCFGFYINALHREIVNRGGWPIAKLGK